MLSVICGQGGWLFNLVYPDHHFASTKWWSGYARLLPILERWLLYRDRLQWFSAMSVCAIWGQGGWMGVGQWLTACVYLIM